MSNEAAGAVSLKMLAERKIEGVGKTTQFKVDPRLLEVEEDFNVRQIDHDHVEGMKKSYKAGAVLPPVYVRVEDGRIILTDGHHRRQAFLELIDEVIEILGVDAIQFRGNDADRVAHMLTSAQGLPLTPLQMGLSYRRLVVFGWEIKAIAERVGKTSSHVGQMIKLAESNTDVQEMVQAKEVPAHIAIKAVVKHGSKAGEVLKEQLNTARLSGKSKVTNRFVLGNSPSDFIKAIKAEMDSGGSFKAEDLFPAYAKLVTYLRSTGSESKKLAA